MKVPDAALTVHSAAVAFSFHLIISGVHKVPI